MAGVGFQLRTLVERDDLLGLVKGYGYAALISSGPWIFTIIMLSLVSLMTGVDAEELKTFQVIVAYNFAFSLVTAGPFTLVATRYFADAIYTKKISGVTGLLLGLLVCVLPVGLLVAGSFYTFVAQLSAVETFAAVVSFVAVTALWICAIFLSALKDYLSFVVIFLVGMLVSLFCSVLGGMYAGLSGLLFGFSAGVMLIVSTIMARIIADFPFPPLQPLAFLTYFRRYWQLALVGLVSAAAIWIDKWIMWSADGNEWVKGGLVYHPSYDPAMFFAYLTTIPSMAAFFLFVETRFFEQFRRFFRDISHHMSYQKIHRNHERMRQQWMHSSRNLIIIQGTVAVIAITLSPTIIEAIGGNYAQLGIFRIGVLGSLFHVLFIFQSILLSYLDLRGPNLLLQLIFLSLNGLLTWWTMNQGFPYFGYGYFLASLLSFLAGFAMTTYAINRLPYLTFVANNPSVKQ